MPYIPQIAYTIMTTYAWDYGLRGVPIAGPPGTPMQVTAEHAPVCYKHVSWLAQAQDSADPQPPDWNTGSDNEVLMQKAISAPFLFDVGDGSTLMTVAGVYVYLLKIPPSDSDQLVMSQPPWDSSLQCVISPNTFMRLLQGVSVNQTGNYSTLQGVSVPQPIQKPAGGQTSLTGFRAFG